MNEHVPQSGFKTSDATTRSLTSSCIRRTRIAILNSWGALVAVAAFGLVSFFSTAAMAQTDEEHAAVLAALNSWNEGWAKKDAGLAVRDYAEDADWTNAFGDRFTSRDQLREGLEFIFSLDFVMAGDSEANEYEDVRFLSDSVALLRSKLVRKGQQFQNGEVRPDRHIHHLRVLEKRGGQWVIISHLISQAQEKS